MSSSMHARWDLTHRKVASLVGVLSLVLLAGCGADDADDAPEVAPDPDAEDAGTEDEADAAADAPFEDGDILTIVVGSPPGGGVDTQARLVAETFEEKLEELTGLDLSVVVENREGGGHRLAGESFYQDEPDGRTMWYALAPLSIGHQVLGGAAYDMADLEPIGGVGFAPRSLLIRSDFELPEDTFMGLVERSQEQPILFGHPSFDLDVALLVHLLREEGVDFVIDDVPMHAADSATALLAGDIEVVWSNTSGLAPHQEDNPDELEFLVSLGCEREENWPDNPTIVEQDVPNAEEICALVGGDDRAFFLPPGTPSEIVDLLSQALEATTADEDYLEAVRGANLLDDWQEPDYISDVVDTLIAVYEENLDELQ